MPPDEAARAAAAKADEMLDAVKFIKHSSWPNIATVKRLKCYLKGQI